jgi:hypothetical protein
VLVHFKGKLDNDEIERYYQFFDMEGRMRKPPERIFEKLANHGRISEDAEALAWLKNYIKNDLVRDLSPYTGVKTLSSNVRQNFAFLHISHIRGFYLSIMTLCVAVIGGEISMTKAELKAKLPPLVQQVHTENEQLFFDALARMKDMAGAKKVAQK